jgi:hypothetical protein
MLFFVKIDIGRPHTTSLDLGHSLVVVLFNVCVHIR